jgi:drug/metabolite transporter (DMT)-like permease
MIGHHRWAWTEINDPAKYGCAIDWRGPVTETIGVLIAVLSSTFGGTAGAVTRYVVGTIDPVTIAAFRFGIGFAVLLPLALVLRVALPRGRDWLWVAALGVMFFAVFFVFYNIALAYTTAARGALALSTLPLWTMMVAALLGAEPLTARKMLGVSIAVGGVAVALLVGLGIAPPGAWRGDLIMVAATLCMAFYNVWSRPFIARSSPLGFVTASMGAGAICLVVVATASGGFAVAHTFSVGQWIAVLYLGAFGGAMAFFLWVLALRITTPTRVANTMTVNPIAASSLAAVLVGEPIGWNLLVGLIAVASGIWLASTPPRQKNEQGQSPARTS